MSFLRGLSELVEEDVAMLLIHAKERAPRFRQGFDRYPVLVESDLFERVHTKVVTAVVRWMGNRLPDSRLATPRSGLQSSGP